MVYRPLTDMPHYMAKRVNRPFSRIRMFSQGTVKRPS